MSLSVGIVGLPNAGKSTLFNALLGRSIAPTAQYPFTTIEPKTGVVPVPDERLEKLAEVVAQQNKSHTSSFSTPGVDNILIILWRRTIDAVRTYFINSYQANLAYAV